MKRHAIAAGDIVDMAEYRRAQRVDACRGNDPLVIVVAYAQATNPPATFGKIYRDDAVLCLHKVFADIVVDAAIDLHTHYGWRMKLLDGLRTVDAQIAMLESKDTDPVWYEKNMLSKPGSGAHPKGMAIDLMAIDECGREIDMGTAFDSHDAASARNAVLPEPVESNRMIVEKSLMRAAFQRGLLLAPLRSEHWDYRVPEDIEDGWRVLESLCRISRIPFDKTLEGKAFQDYRAFRDAWHTLFDGREKQLLGAIGTCAPPAETLILYHGDYLPLCDADLFPRHRQSAKDYAAAARAVVDEIKGRSPAPRGR